MRSLRQLTTALLLGALMLARTARADEKDTAKTLFEQGIADLEAKNYDKACPALDQSQKLDPRPGTLFALAECEGFRGHGVVAYARYGEYLQVYASLSRDKQAKQGSREKDARAKRAELERTLAQATFSLPADAPAGTVVTRDGAPLAASDLGSPVMLDPGAHIVTTQVPDGPVNEQRFTLEKGEKRTISLEVKTSGPAATSAPQPLPPPSSSTSSRRIATFAAGGLGVVGIAVGGITGGLMLSKQGTIKDNCRAGSPGVQLCNTEGASAGNDAKTLGAIATAGFAVGLVGLGAAVVLFVTTPKQQKAAAATAIEVRAAPIGSEGAMVGVRGSF